MYRCRIISHGDIYRPPPLDTINRTLHNIDMAIAQQQLDMKSLRSRINGLSISSDGVIPRNSHLMGSQMKRPLNVTPNVATTTAAALNAERSAQKFKCVLLATRSSSLLSNKVAQVSVPTSFQMPQKPSMVKPDPETPACIFSLPATPVMTFHRHL